MHTKRKRERESRDTMANMGVELIGFLLSMCGLVMTIVACSLPEWKTNDMEGEVIESIRRSSGLWSKVTTRSSPSNRESNQIAI